MKIRILLCLVVLVFSVTSTTTFARAASAPVDFTLPTHSGTVSFNALHAKVVLVDFWASWCAPCKQSFPWMINMYNQYSSKGLAIVAINLDKKQELADDFLEYFNVPFIVAFDPAGKTAEAFNVEAMPSSFLVSPTGAILYSHPGFDPAKTGEIESRIKEACSK